MIPGIVAGQKRWRADGDPHWANVSGLLHFDGPVGSTTLVDEKGNVWTAVGDAKLDGDGAFAQSLLLDGVGDCASTPAAAQWALGAVDFTLEARIKPSASGAYLTIASQWRAGNAALCAWGLRVSDTGALEFIYNGTGTVSSTAGAVAPGVWQYVAAVRSGNTLLLYVDDALVGSVAFTGTINTSSAAVAIGTESVGFSPTKYFAGRVDEFRVTKGVARAISGAPAEPFPDN